MHPSDQSGIITTAKTWKPPECLLTDKRIKKTWFIHTMGYYSVMERMNEIMPFTATWMDLEIIVLSEVIQKEKSKYHLISLTYGI